MSTPSPQREWLDNVQTTSWGCDCPYAYTTRLGTQLQQDSKLAIQKNIMAEQIFQVWVINYFLLHALVAPLDSFRKPAFWSELFWVVHQIIMIMISSSNTLQVRQHVLVLFHEGALCKTTLSWWMCLVTQMGPGGVSGGISCIVACKNGDSFLFEHRRIVYTFYSSHCSHILNNFFMKFLLHFLTETLRNDEKIPTKNGQCGITSSKKTSKWQFIDFPHSHIAYFSQLTIEGPSQAWGVYIFW